MKGPSSSRLVMTFERSRNHEQFFGVILLAFATTASAQIGTGSIKGVIVDSSGAAIPDVEITVRKVETDVPRVTRSTGSGDYVVSGLLPGHYAVSANKSGFSVVTVPAFEL